MDTIECKFVHFFTSDFCHTSPPTKVGLVIAQMKFVCSSSKVRTVQDESFHQPKIDFNINMFYSQHRTIQW